MDKGKKQLQFDGDEKEIPPDNPGGIEPVGPGSLAKEPLPKPPGRPPRGSREAAERDPKDFDP